MNVSFNLKCLSCISVLATIVLQETEGDSKGPGGSSCYMITADCKTVPVPFDDLPDSCTSFMFTNSDIDTLDKLSKSGKKVFSEFGRNNYGSWAEFLDVDGINAMKQADFLKNFITEHPGLTGLMLINLEPTIHDTNEFVGYTECLTTFINITKQKTGLEIGVSFRSDDFLAYYDKPKMPWLNFTRLDYCIDFYVFTLFSFTNECSGNSGGVIPISGNDMYTLEKLKCAIDKSLIPADKIHFTLPLAPQSKDDICNYNYEKLCKFPDKTKYWCTDTQETMFEKGQWFQENGAGFIGGYIDYDDPQNVCKCGKYPSFNAVLAGFNGTAAIPVCPLYDRVV